MAQVNISINDELKARTSEITTKTDPFYNTENMKTLRQSIKEANEGKLTAHEMIDE
ncbi:MAG: hypothetical protein LBI04_00115 [Treponema sp.]|jgi:hypothetical protein|nr:hypothetical protein [Treponema sp.]